MTTEGRRRRWLQIAAGIAVWVSGAALTLAQSPPAASDSTAAPPGGALDPHDPEVERATFRLLPGFEVNLFAAEPMLAKPIHMTWDAQGRLWVASSTAYPQVAPGQLPNDQIVVLEDTDGDGRADKSTVFADGLYVPTGLELGDGGVYVANAPDLLFLKDTDGDGRADVRQVVFSGFGTEDNHHSISAWRWGPGGWLYFQEGTFLHTQVETPYGVVRLENGGVFEFHPRSRRLRVFADYRASNPWGHMFDRWGQSILIDNPQIYYLTPLSANSRAKLPYQSLYVENTKLCGGEFVSGRHLSELMRGELWTNAYKTHAIHRYRLEELGSGYVVQPLEPVLESSSDYFRPVDLKVGPDGAVYVADWYNLLIGHMQYEFRDPRRDKTHGRIWRIRASDRPLLETEPLAEMPLAELVEKLKAPEDWTRYQTKRLLAECHAGDAAAALAGWVARLDPADADFEHHRLEALWAYQTIDIAAPDLLNSVLGSSDARARAAAVRVLRYWYDRVPDGFEHLRRAVADEHPRVRLEAVLALSFVPHPDALVVALGVLDQPVDRFIDHALRLAVDALQPHWLSAYREGRVAFADERHRDFALANTSSVEILGPLMAMLNSGAVDPSRLEAMLPVVAGRLGPAELEPIWGRLTGTLAGGLPPEVTAGLLGALESASRRRGVRPREDLGRLQRLLADADPAVRLAAIGLAGAWRLKSAARPLSTMVGDQALALHLRLAAAMALGELGDGNAMRLFDRLAASDDPAARYVAAAGLLAVDVERAAGLLARAYAVDPRGADPLPPAALLLGRKGGGDSLAVALGETRPHGEVARRLLQYLNETGLIEPALSAALRKALPPTSLESELLAEDPIVLAAAVLEHGGAARGQSLFRSERLACVKCHALAGAGPDLGPDLSSVGSSSPVDYLVDSVLRPSKAIKDQYQGVTVATIDGRVVTGVLVYQDKNQVVLRDAAQQGRQMSIPAAEIDETAPLTTSLMPSGLCAELETRQDFLDLARFLVELGRPGPLAADKSPVIRTWRVRNADSSPTAAEAARAGGEWRPLYARVDGTLPAAELGPPGSFALLRGQVEVLRPGDAVVRVNSPLGVQLLQADGRLASTVDGVWQVALRQGRHEVTLVVDLARHGEAELRCLVEPATAAATRLQPIGGP